MLTAEFSKQSLRSMIRRKDGNQGVLKEKHLRENYLTWLENSISTNDFKFGALKRIKIGSFLAYQPSLLGDELVLRRINSIIRNRYSTRQSDRNSIIQQATVLLEESCPKYIYKIDIAKFYESVDRDFLIKKLLDDNLVTSTTHNLISILFENFGRYARFGLPRGLSISATLAELYLKDLDKRIAELDGVYYYSRYVDDMLIFSSVERSTILADIAKILPGKMKLNPDKCSSYFVGCNCLVSCRCGRSPCPCAAKCICPTSPEIEINYLGYKLSSPKIPPKDIKKKIKIDVSMAENKVRRIKTRMALAFVDNHKLPNYPLLYDRIKFLTENRRIKKLGKRGKLMSGIHYNYPLITNIKPFVDMNNFLRAQIYAQSGSFGMKQRSILTTQQKDGLAKLSFVSGFISRRSKPVTSHSLKNIRKCW